MGHRQEGFAGGPCRGSGRAERERREESGGHTHCDRERVSWGIDSRGHGV